MTAEERAHGLVLFLSDADEYHWPSLITQAIKDAVGEYQQWERRTYDDHLVALHEAVRLEREACAKVAENASPVIFNNDFPLVNPLAMAAAIRNRK